MPYYNNNNIIIIIIIIIIYTLFGINTPEGANKTLITLRIAHIY